jgi:hypothetical protein
MFRGGGKQKSPINEPLAQTLVTPHGRGHDIASNNTIERYLSILEAPHLLFKVLRHLTHGACYARPTTFHFYFYFFFFVKSSNFPLAYHITTKKTFTKKQKAPCGQF